MACKTTVLAHPKGFKSFVSHDLYASQVLKRAITGENISNVALVGLFGHNMANRTLEDCLLLQQYRGAVVLNTFELIALKIIKSPRRQAKNCSPSCKSMQQAEQEVNFQCYMRTSKHFCF